MWFYLPQLEVSLLLSLSWALFWRGLIGGLVRGVVLEAGAFPAVEGGGGDARRDVGWGKEGVGRGGAQESQTVALCNQPLSICAVPSQSRGASGRLLVAPASADVDGLWGCAGEQGRISAILSGACGHCGRTGMSWGGERLNGMSSNSSTGWSGGWLAACCTDR